MKSKGTIWGEKIEDREIFLSAATDSAEKEVKRCMLYPFIKEVSP